MIQNEGILNFSITPDAEKPRDSDFAICFRESEALLEESGGVTKLPTFASLGGETGNAVHLMTGTDARVFLVEGAGESESLKYRPISLFRSFSPGQHGFYLITAYHLSQWMQKNRFCGHCGGDMAQSKTERALICKKCSQTVYPVISPAIAVALYDGDRLLLARNACRNYKRFTLLAGFVEAGETLEQTVHREVMEEVGLRVKNLRYIASQPWGLTQSEMIGFSAELDGPDVITLQTSELTEARWFARNEIEADASPASLTHEMIEMFRKGEIM